MSLSTRLYSALFGEYQGRDEYGNRYYRRKVKNSAGPSEKRWVVYKDLAEPSLVPPRWHGWLHYMTNELPGDEKVKLYPWQKDAAPNFTGTPLAYRPPGHISQGGHRPKATGDYVAWVPDERNSE